jgi:hypothetical protein
VEEISHRHNFRCFRASTPDEATLTAGSYTLELNSTNFSTMMGATGYFKEILAMFRRISGKQDYGPIKFIDDKLFHDTYGYVDYTSRTQGYPNYYTRLGDVLWFNCPASEDLIIRVWYQKYHPPFTDDTTSHSFDSQDNMLAFNAIVYQSLVELKSSLHGIEFPKELQGVTAMAEHYIRLLIARDAERDLMNEHMDLLGWSERSHFDDAVEDPYSWT